MIKWNVVSRLAKEAGIICAGARPGILFLNGEYYGIIQLQEKYTRYNVASAIGAQKSDIEKYEPNEVNSSRFGEYYNRLHADLNDPKRQAKLEESVDMPDMLRHYAVNIIMNNVDWPFHNFLSWKCAETSSSAYGDGRVRFFLYDLDAVYQDTTDLETKNIFDYLMDEPIEDMTDTLTLLMQSDKYRTEFVNMVCDLTGTVFAADNVLEVIDEENAKIAHSMEIYYSDADRTRQQAAVEEMKEAAAESCVEVHAGLQQHLGAADPYELTVEAPEQGQIAFSRIRLDVKRKEAGKQFVDVGIAEETAVALASGIAANGGKPVYGVYSTFVQRTYDQISQDLCINNSPATIVTFCGSVYGMNDVTHLGLYDIPMMANIPNLVYLAATSKEDYIAMLDWSLEQTELPVAIKLPGGAMVSTGTPVTKDFSKLNKYEVTKKGSKIAILGLGTFYGLACEAAAQLEAETGIQATVINPYYITGLDTELLDKLKEDHELVLTIEDGILDGGFGEKIARYYGTSNIKVRNYGLKKEFLDRYDPNEVVKENHLTAEQIVADIKALEA